MEHWPFFRSDPLEEELVLDEAYADAFTEGLRLHANAGVKKCASLGSTPKPCQVCRQSFEDEFFMWRMQVKLSREEPVSALGTPLSTFGHAAGQMARAHPEWFKNVVSKTRQDPYEDASTPA